MSNPRFAIRTVKNGTVKIQGKIFKVQDPHRPYNGELDGLRFAFGLYYNARLFPEQGEFVSLWGTESLYRFKGDRDSPENKLLWETEPNKIGGYIHWVWWCDDVNIDWHRQCREKAKQWHLESSSVGIKTAG